MANKQRAEVEVTSAAGTVYTFRLGMGVLCQLEETLNLDVKALHEKLQEGFIPASMLREMVKATAIDPLAPSNEAACELIDELGFVTALQTMQRAFLLAMDAEKRDENGNAAAPFPPVPPVDKKRARRATGAGISTAAPS